MNNMKNPDIKGYVNPNGMHTAGMFSAKTIGGRRRRLRRIKSRKFRRTRSNRTRRYRRRQRGGTTSPTYSSYATVGPNEYLSRGESALASPHIGALTRMYR